MFDMFPPVEPLEPVEIIEQIEPVPENQIEIAVAPAALFGGALLVGAGTTIGTAAGEGIVEGIKAGINILISDPPEPEPTIIWGEPQSSTPPVAPPETTVT